MAYTPEFRTEAVRLYQIGGRGIRVTAQQIGVAPGTAYSGLDDDQFRQYAWSVMQMLLEMMREGQVADGM